MLCNACTFFLCAKKAWTLPQLQFSLVAGVLCVIAAFGILFFWENLQ
jgi:hypothetical protein